ncbi:SARP family transcriptional regulator [Virgisporangium aliadipatigenens]|uniref:SARP family transcriptional regulator n=1 Tax=Virgisporangium aliadipatigenens TaxID=741659 RepID=A0A8J3YKU4_9ACTN|nr:BTAD domain-containing putative transcriptional regulator [Virgisporangium aliadipatigenens]GIJ47026.1 SARP family transcriptional regulator [Virgisporangium aliadipatigenens]
MRTFAVLGPTEASLGDGPVDIGGPLPRRLLAALVVAERRPVPDDRLAELIWADSPPAEPGTAVQVYVSRLRRALADGDRSVISRAPAGYRLAAEPGATDVERFAARVATARALTGAAAVTAFEEALALWRGEPYQDLPDDVDVAAARARLREFHETVQEEHVTARLAAGDEVGAIAALEGLVRAAPLRERRWELLAIALYRAGRHAEAVAALGRARELIAAELGVDPGPELSRLERELAAPAPRPVARPTRPLSSFVGRDADLALLSELVATRRLVTVVGTLGMGKTRLVNEYAATRTDHDGPWLVRLADVTDPAALPSAIAGALRLAERAGEPFEPVAAALRGRHGLLILDNCEHLVRHVAAFTRELLGRVPDLRVLATSRVPLGVDGEHLLPLGPLSTVDAAALLADRIGAVRPQWTPDAGEVRSLADALDGIPLAIELAAARTRVLGVHEITAGLDDRFEVLGSALEAAVAWSVGLLTPAVRAALLRLWPFEGGFPRSAVEGPDALDAITTLVEHSLVVAETDGPQTRYRMLETIRAYCRKNDPAPAASRAAHAAWVHAFLAESVAALRGRHAAAAIRAITRELPNIRAAIGHDLDAAPTAALRSAGLMLWHWARSGLLAEGRRLLDAALRAAPDAPTGDIALARAARAVLGYADGEVAGAHARINAAARLVDPAAEPVLYGELRFYEALAHLPAGDPESALAAATEAHRHGRATGAGWLIAQSTLMWGSALALAGRTDEAAAKMREANRVALDHGIGWSAAISELMLAQLLLDVGGPAAADEAIGLLCRAVAGFRAEEDIVQAVLVLHNGVIALAATGAPVAELRAAVHRQVVRHGLVLEQTYAWGRTPEGWYEGVEPTGEPLSLDDTVALFLEHSGHRNLPPVP